MQIFIIARNDPPDFSLPVIIVDQNLQLVPNPLIRRYITSLTSHRDCLQCTDIIFVNPLTRIVLLSDRSQPSRTGVQSVHFEFLNDCPERTGIGDGRLAFVEHSCSPSQQRPVNCKTVSYHPPNIARCKVSITQIDIHYVFHGPIQSDRRPSMVPNDALRRTRSTRCVEDVKVICANHFLGWHVLKGEFGEIEMNPLGAAGNIEVGSLVDQHVGFMFGYFDGFGENFNVVDLLIGL